LKGGGGDNNQPGQWHRRMPSMVVAVVASWLLLFCGCGRGCCGCTFISHGCVIVSRGCIVVVAVPRDKDDKDDNGGDNHDDETKTTMVTTMC